MVDLSSNLLTFLPEGIFENAGSVEYIHLQRNKLVTIQNMIFNDLRSLIHIDLSDNCLATVSDFAVNKAYFEYYQFTSIDLSRNDLKDIPIWLLNLDLISKIDLSGNKISFHSIRILLQKIVNAQKVSDPHEKIDVLNGFKSINLCNNSFTGFDISTLDNDLRYTFNFIFMRVRLNFGEFVFNCDCKMFSLYQLIYSFGLAESFNRDVDNTINYNANGFNCLHPAELRGMSLVQIPIYAFGCDEELTTCPKQCRCWVRTVDQAVKVNCANQSRTRLPDSLPNGSVELDFSRNDLFELPKVPYYVEFLQLLDLSENHLQSVNQNAFKVRYNISVLRLHNNELTTLPKTVSNINLGTPSKSDKHTYQITLDISRRQESKGLLEISGITRQPWKRCFVVRSHNNLTMCWSSRCVFRNIQLVWNRVGVSVN